GCLPGKQHAPVLGKLVLALLGGQQVCGIDVLEANEDAGNTGASRLLDEARNLVAKSVYLDHESYVEAVLLTQLNDAIVYRLPVSIASKVVIGDEKAVDTLCPIEANDSLDAVWRSAARLASLNIDDGAERALIRAATSGIKTRHVTDSALHEFAMQEGR